MSTSKDAASLIDIAKAAHKILKYKQSLSKSEFIDDDKTQSSILYQLLIIGEAVKKTSLRAAAQLYQLFWGCTKN